jgi:hypothetical protein
MPFNKLDDTAIGKIKPRFKLETSESKEDMMKLILAEAEKDVSIRSSAVLQNIRIKLPTQHQHYWSPVMNLSFDWDGYDNKLQIRGVIGPNDKVWTMFMFFYIGTIMIGLFGGIWSLTKWQIHDDMSLLFIIPLTIFVFGSIFSTVKYGKRKAHTQMIHLLRLLRKAVDSVDCKRADD